MSVAHPLHRPQIEPLAARLQRLRWRYPEWWAMALSVVAWIPLVAGFGAGHATADQIAGGHHHAGHAIANAPAAWPMAATAWLVMVVAMMFPLLGDALRTTAARSLWPRRERAIALFLAGYVTPWLIAGAGALALARMLDGAAPVVATAAFVAAALWQLTAAKKRALLSCHRTMPLAPHGWRADRDCLRYGWTIGRQCVVSCGAMMVACLLASHHLVAMAGVTAVGVVERRAPRLTPRVTAASLLVFGLLLLA